MWAKYRFKYGPMNPVRKYDAGHALVASQINRGNGGKATAKDFMPYGKKEDDEVIDGTLFVDKLSQHKGVKIGR